MPAALIFVEGGSGQTTQRGRPFPSRIIVRVFDENSNWMPNEEVKFSLPSSLAQPSGRFPGGVFDDTVLTNGIGRATSGPIDADDVLGTWVGVVSSVATPAVKADFYLSNVVTPFVPSGVQLISGDNQSAVLGNAYQPVVARLIDEVGNGASGQLEMTVDAGFGTFTTGFPNAFASTDGAGYATFPPFIAGGQLGFFGFQIRYPSLTAAVGTFQNFSPDQATTIQPISGNNQSAPAGAPFLNPLVVRVVNGGGSPISGAFVTFSAYPVGGASLVWTPPVTDPAAAISDVNGYATSPSFSANGVEGTYAVYASSPPAPITGFQLTNGAFSPTADTSALILCEV